MPIEWDPAKRQLHLRNDQISYVVRVLENGALGGLHFGPALALGRSYDHLGLGPFLGFANRVGDPVALECPTAGSGDPPWYCATTRPAYINELSTLTINPPRHDWTVLAAIIGSA